MEHYNIHCSWIVNGNKNIKNTIVFNDCIDLSKVGDEFVSLDTCLQLIKPSESFSECTIQVSCSDDADFAISHLIVLSEARNMEVYGNQDEYLLTVKGNLLEKVDDMVVYLKKVTFKKSRNMFSCKFLSLNLKNTMWLYGIEIGIEKRKLISKPLYSSVDLIQVKTMLEDASKPLSPSAEKFLELVEHQHETVTDLFQLFQRLPQHSQPTVNGIHSFTSPYSNGQTEVDKVSAYCNLLKTVTRDKHSLFDKSDSPPFSEMFTLLQRAISPEPKKASSKIISDQEQNSLLEVVTQRLNEMEGRFYKQISEVELRLQSKLDYLINLMENKTKS